MNAIERGVSALARPGIEGEPLYFPSGENTLFGWLHRPAGSATPSLGLVICSPFGYEALCAHRSIRVFAQMAASAGVPALRFDYRGTGDSSDVPEDTDQVRDGTQDVHAAIEALRRRTGVDRVCLLGVRFGALLAALVATESAAVDSTVLIGPIVSGRRYLRELRTTQLAGAAFAGAAAAEPKPGGIEVSGFTLHPATLSSLGSIDLMMRGGPRWPPTLLLDSDLLPSARPWADALAATGGETEYHALPGLVGMAMTPPQFAAVPIAMVEKTRTWLERRAHPSSGSGPRPDSSTLETPVMTLAGGHAGADAEITERPIFLQSGVPLFGIVTEPRPGERRRRAVILINAGADFHVGASRMYVPLARRWARGGYHVLRFDLAGIGDSATRPDLADDDVFPEAALEDIRAGIDYLRTQHRIGEVTLAGLCSGAYHALRAAIACLPVQRLLMINPQTFFWKKGMSIDDIQLIEVANAPSKFRHRLREPSAWIRLLTGKVDFSRIMIVNLRRSLLTLELLARRLARGLKMPLPNDLGWELQRLVRRGVHLVFVFARHEPGLEVLRLQGGSTIAALGDRCRVHIIDDGDHVFTRIEPRRAMERILDEELREAGEAVADAATQ